MTAQRTLNFSQVQWGPDEAKGDRDLSKYFVPFPEFDRVRNGTYRYVIGRKGAGKTAVIERIRLETENDATCFRSSLSLRKFPISEFRDMRDKSYRDKSQFVSAWLFLMYVELAKLVCGDHGAEPRELVDDLRAFLKVNGLAEHIGFTQTVTTLRKTDHKLKLNAKWLEAESAGGEQVQHQAIVHYNKVVELLEDKLRQVRSNSQFWIFMDELDEGYQAGDANIRLILLALLRAVEESSIQLRSTGLDFRPLLVLRTDIFDRLEDNDLNKLDDHVMRLRWTSAEDNGPNSLRRITAARIRATFPELNGDPWDQLVEDYDNDLPPTVKSVWAYLAARTHERPRDLVKFLKCCQKVSSPGLLTLQEVREAEVVFSNWLYGELRDEIHSYLPCWSEALNCISQCGTWRIKPDELRLKLSSDRVVKKWMDEHNRTPDELIDMLFDFGVLGTLGDRNRWLFKYKDESLRWDGASDLLVHFGFNKKLRLK